MLGTVTRFGGYFGPGTVWVQLDGDCQVPLLPEEFTRLGKPARLGMRVKVAVGDIHPYLVRILHCPRCRGNERVLAREYLEWMTNSVEAYCTARRQGQSPVEATKTATVAFPKPKVETVPCPECSHAGERD